MNLNNVKHLILWTFFCSINIILSPFVAFGKQQLRIEPNSLNINRNEELSFTIILEESLAGQEVDSIHAVEFDIVPSIGHFSSMYLLDTSKSWMAPVNVQTVQKEFGMHALISHFDNDNVSGSGKIVSYICIMTIDDIQGVYNPNNDDCIPLTIKLENARLWTKNDYTQDILLPLDTYIMLEDDSIQVNFCIKCQLDDISVTSVCSSNGLTYTSLVSFTGEPNATYTITDNYGVAYAAFGNFTKIFGPYNSSTTQNILITNDNVPFETCNITLSVNCEKIPALPTCSDGIKNQDETNVDCGGSCVPCCAITATAKAVCINNTEFNIEYKFISGNGVVQFRDNYGHSANYTQNPTWTHTFGPYTKGDHVIITAQKFPLNSGCYITLPILTYDHCESCSFIFDNNECVESTPLTYGINGIYQNNCADHSVNEPQTLPCIVDDLTNTVWFSFVGDGSEVTVTANNCRNHPNYNPKYHYNNDLQFGIYYTCGSTQSIACSEDDNIYQPQATISTINGHTYYIMVDGYGNKEPVGNFCISLCSSIKGYFTSTQLSCPSNSDGLLSFVPTTGNQPFTYYWSNGASKNPLSSLAQGVYSVTVTDSNGCIGTASTTLSAMASALAVSQTLVSPGINGGISPFYYNSININPQGGVEPYTYNWSSVGYFRITTYNNGQANISYADNSIWEVTITDANGCYVTTNNISGDTGVLDIESYIITNQVGASANGAIDLMVNGGQAPYTFKWTGPFGFTAITEDINNVAAGWYSIKISDSSTPTQYTEGWYWVGKSVAGRNKTNSSEFNVTSINHNFVTLNYVLPFNAEAANISFYNLQGQKIYESSVFTVHENIPGTIKVPISNLKYGLYLAEMNTPGFKIKPCKIVIYK